MARLSRAKVSFCFGLFVSALSTVVLSYPVSVPSGPVIWQFQPDTFELTAQRNGQRVVISNAASDAQTFETPAENRLGGRRLAQDADHP